MTETLKGRLFLRFDVYLEDWDLPPHYLEAIKPYVASIPTDFLLPWPPEITPEEGSRVYMSGLPTSKDTLIVGKAECFYSAHSGYAKFIECEMETIGEGRQLDLHTLLCMSEQGLFLESGDITIKEVLDEAGIPSTTEGMDH